jgi:hypothetical protein
MYCQGALSISITMMYQFEHFLAVYVYYGGTSSNALADALCTYCCQEHVFSRHFTFPPNQVHEIVRRCSYPRRCACEP